MTKKGRYVYEWPRPMVTTDAVVFCNVHGRVKLLLIRRGKEPFKGKWAFPGGFVEMDEELEVSAARELAEEAGLKGVKLEQMHTFGTIGRDPRGRQISVAFIGIVEAEQMDVKAGDDAVEVKWFDIDDLPEMAFDHNQMAEMAIRKIVNE